ncbi:hypothetical protein COU80_04450 [Candidatus Peregrinibacteria bacterium CG10_big_fil_rev_8_21_14_0_10_55_24]|nr:MAG: hypothetical protein COU80_04450 [Candidatus Peregrinibacteria bacterium CG10_big_fil_rev_8_21_14_0_10_55_24]
METSSSSQPIKEYEPGIFEGGSYHWQQDAKITDILGGDYMPETLEDARALVVERFGCVLHALPRDIQRDPEALMTATVLSSGHELLRVHSAVQDLLTPEFALEAARRGVPGWLLKAYPENVRDTLDVVSAYVALDGHALHHASDRLRSDPTIIEKAIQQHHDAIIHAINPPEHLQEIAEMLRRGKNGAHGAEQVHTRQLTRSCSSPSPGTPPS